MNEILEYPVTLVGIYNLFTMLFQEMSQYNQTSSLALPPGLYLGYLKLQASVDLIRVLVSHNAPNVLPSVRVRDCSNVSR